MAKVFRTLRNNWKKSTFAAVLGYYGIEYGRNWHKNYLIMREYSKEALIHGQRPLPQGAKNKHITLFLNPTAGSRNAKKNMEKFSEPLLHLAGFLVSTVKTERMDEAKDLAGIIEKTNIIAVAGGDGTLFETVTGLLRRDDVTEAIRRYPVGVIPVGSHNQFAKRVLNYNPEYSDPKFIAESTMAIVRHKMKPQDVMEVTILEDEPSEEGEEVKKALKPFYSLAGITIGLFREAQKIKDEMPSFFPNYFATFLSLFRAPDDQVFKAEIRYLPTCVGCTKCKKLQVESPKIEQVTVPQKNVDKQPSIWSRIFSVFQPVHAQDLSLLPSKDENKLIENPNCGNWTSFCVETSEFNVKSCGNGRLQMQINTKLNKTDFMIEGLKRYRNEPSEFSQVIDCQEVEILPIEGLEFLSIDNEEFDMKRIKVRCLKDKLYFFSLN